MLTPPEARAAPRIGAAEGLGPQQVGAAGHDMHDMRAAVAQPCAASLPGLRFVPADATSPLLCWLPQLP